jgi:hypothetical protein
MENFTTRVELHNADEGDYELLRQEMRDVLFCQAVKHRGVWHDLPVNEYDCLSDFNTTFIYNLAHTAAKNVVNNKPVNDKHQLKDFWIIVTKSDGDRVFKLSLTTDASRLPAGETLF